MSLLPTIDTEGFQRGFIAEEAVNEFNSSVVVNTPLPEDELAPFCKWKWDGTEWQQVADHRGHSWYNPANPDEVHTATTFDDEPPVGWTYWEPGENKVVPDALLLERAKLVKTAAITQERERRNHLPIAYSGTDFDADENGQRNISAWMVNIAAGITPPEGFVWRDHYNVNHPADAAFVLGLGSAVTVRGTLLYQTSWAKKAALDALTTVAEVEAFDPLAGW